MINSNAVIVLQVCSLQKDIIIWLVNLQNLLWTEEDRVNDPDNFCYVCGQFSTRNQRQNLSQRLKTAYKHYFDCEVSDLERKQSVGPPIVIVIYALRSSSNQNQIKFIYLATNLNECTLYRLGYTITCSLPGTSILIIWRSRPTQILGWEVVGESWGFHEIFLYLIM